MTDLVALNDKLLERLREGDFAGWDPFDMLNSRFFKATPFYRLELARLAFIQFGKRSPLNFRRLFAVPKVRNAKGVGLCILGLLEDHQRTGDANLIAEARSLGDWLLSVRSDPAVWNHACWGYPFDWQARAFYVPRGKPNAITTVYVARALLALGDATGDQRYIDVAIDAGRFIARHLYTVEDGKAFFAYIPGEKAFVHNASLWAAAWCGVAGARSGDDALLQLGLEIARRSVGEQAADGSWVYGSKPHHQFIDGFHTAYNLEALALLGEVAKSDEFAASIERGFYYYKATFFEPNGLVKYYDNQAFPLDTHCVAQAIVTLLKLGKAPEDRALCDKVIAWAIDTLYDPRTHFFLYQRTRRVANRIPYARWTQAWAFYALAYYNRMASGDLDATD